MKTTIIIGFLVIAVGIFYSWTWSQGIKQMGDLAIASDMPRNWTQLKTQKPQLAVVLHILRVDPFVESETASQNTMEIARRVFTEGGRHAVGGLILAALSLGFMAGFGVDEVRRRRGSSGPAH